MTSDEWAEYLEADRARKWRQQGSLCTDLPQHWMDGVMEEKWQYKTTFISKECFDGGRMLLRSIVYSILATTSHTWGKKAKQQHCVWNPQRLSDIHVYLFALTNVSINTHKIPSVEYRKGFVWCGATASDFNAVWGSTFVWMGLTAIN